MVLVKGDKVIAWKMETTTMDPDRLSDEMMKELLEKKEISEKDVMGVASTGQGRKSIEFADISKTEFMTFALAATKIHRPTRLVVDMGGQGVRLMALDDNGTLSNFITNDKCSSGTGTFLDTMAVSLELNPKDMGQFGLCSECPSHINATCTVFAESEMVSLVAKGQEKQDIVAGLAKMVAKRVASLTNVIGVKGDILMAGGVSRNATVVQEYREQVGHNVFVPRRPHILGAYGAALMLGGDVDISALEESDRTKKKGRGAA